MVALTATSALPVTRQVADGLEKSGSITYCLLGRKADAVRVQVFQEGSVNRIRKFTHFHGVILVVLQRRTKMLTPEGRQKPWGPGSSASRRPRRDTSSWGSQGEPTRTRGEHSTAQDSLPVSHLHVPVLVPCFLWQPGSSLTRPFWTRQQVHTRRSRAASAAARGKTGAVLPGRVPAPRPLSGTYGNQVGLFS